jgi:hypothetical protein
MHQLALLKLPSTLQCLEGCETQDERLDSVVATDGGQYLCGDSEIRSPEAEEERVWPSLEFTQYNSQKPSILDPIPP